MPAAIDITNQRFGQLVAIEVAKRTKGGQRNARLWRCVCDCGKETFAKSHTLRSGHTTSCGHDRMKNMHAARDKTKTVHGRSRTGDRTWRTWSSMFSRCYTSNDPSYAYYGGRGITVCERWSVKGGQGFLNFLADMGEAPAGLSLDRIGVNGNYSKNNCRWATPREQANNRRNNIIHTHHGKSMTNAEWARELGIHPDTLLWRAKHWGVHKALSTPAR